MRKKLLLAENANLFAEIERKQIENETLKVKLETEKGLIAQLEKENADLKARLSQAEIMLEEKKDEIERLKLLKEKAVAVPTCTEKTEQEEEKEVLHTEEAVKEAPLATLTLEQRQRLTEEGALAIARLTKVIAKLYGEAEDLDPEKGEQVYSMALGKNEAFKIKLSKLLLEEGRFEEILEKLNALTEKTEEEIKALIK